MASRFLKFGKSEESFTLPSCLSHIKMEKHNNSNRENAFSDNAFSDKFLRTRIVHLLKNHPSGIQIERFNQAYKTEFDEYLYPFDYGFNDLVDLLKSFSPVLSMNVEKYGESSEIILYAKRFLGENELIKEKNIHIENQNLNLEICHKGKDSKKKKLPKTKKKSSKENLPASAKLPSKVLNAFNSILSSHSGGINIDWISSEYKYYTGEELEPSRLGFNSILDMLSNLSDIFSICELTNGGFILRTSTENQVITQNSEIKNSNKNSLFCPSISDECEEDVGINRKLPLEVQNRLKLLFENHFPNGLEINEIVGAYRGIYGAILEDLTPLEYGYSTLEAFLKAHNHLLNVQVYDNNIMVFHAGYLKEVTSSIAFPLPACSAVSSNESYTTRNNCEVFMINTKVNFVIGEVYTPYKFHVIHQGEESSEALNALLDQMYEFYNSPISKRYEVKKESMILRTPVVALYSNDMSWYRAIIISFNNINKVKLFLVDYGTTCICPYTSLRLLHRNFFELPAQAMRASLYGIKPIKENQYWSKSASNIFKDLVQNRYFHGRVHEVSENVVVSLWDDNNNINELLVTKGFASYIDGYEKEINDDKIIDWMNKIDINENNTIMNFKTHVEPQEHKNEKLIDFSSAPVIEVNENMDLINTETAYHKNGSEMKQIHYGNGKNSTCSKMVNVQSIDELYKKRKVELVKITSDQNIHIVYLCGEPYMLSSEISGFMWDSDELPQQLEREKIDVPHVVIKSSTHADIFTQLSSFGVKNILDESNEFGKLTVVLYLYPLETTLKILNIFKYKNIATMNIIKGVIHGWRD